MIVVSFVKNTLIWYKEIGDLYWGGGDGEEELTVKVEETLLACGELFITL